MELVRVVTPITRLFSFFSFFFCSWKGGVEQCYQPVRTDGHHSSPSPLTHDLTAGLKAITCVHEIDRDREKQEKEREGKTNNVTIVNSEEIG